MQFSPKLKYYFVAGVEGVGHHGLNPVLKKSLETSQQIQKTHGEVITNKRRLKRVFNVLWCYENPSWLLKKWANWYARYFFRKEQQKALKNNQVRIIIEDNSFPAGNYRNQDRQWNLQEMIDIVSPYADIYFIGLYRNPIASSYSRQNIDGGLHQHAPVVKTSLINLDKQLSALNPEKLLVVHYEDMMDRQSQFANTVSKYLEISKSDLNEGLKLVRKSGKNWKKDLPDDDQDKLRQVFPGGCEKAWPILANSSIKQSQ
ncbi:MAG: hypothetical protein P8Y24_14035 [Gammaproteobacteria bacterium]